MGTIDRPLSEINTTPLIDVLLVLLIMFVITIPPATHAVSVDLPSCTGDCGAPPLDKLHNRLNLDGADRLSWNGAPVSREQLSAALAASRRLPVEPELQFAADSQASYDAAARTVRQIEASGVTRFGFVGNERFRDFGR